MKSRLISLVLLTIGALSYAVAAPRPVVTLDCYHNTETPAHYTWQKVSLGGYSQFAQLLLGLGTDTSTITTPLDSTTLAPVGVLIIVNPGTTHLIASSEIDAVDKWVQQGGKLMCFANIKGSFESVHYNQLVERFGITFNDTSQSGGPDYGPVPQNEVFSSCTTFYLNGICNLSVLSPAKSIFTYQGSVLMATAIKANGKVFAAADPWVMDEHIAAKDNIKGITQVMNWLLGNNTEVLHRIPSGRRLDPRCPVEGLQRVSSNGRLLSSGSASVLHGTAKRGNAFGVMYNNKTSGMVRQQAFIGR